MNLFENLQLMKESNTVKTEGIFGNSKKKQQQYDEEIKKIFNAPTITVSLKVSGLIIDVMQSLLSGDEKNAKQAVVNMLKVKSNELKKSPRKIITDIIHLGDKTMSTATDELKEYIEKIKKEVRHLDGIGLDAETYIYEKIGEQLVKKIDVLKKKQFEAAIIKDEKDMEQVVESTQLRRFTGKDSWTWGGATNFADGEPPMIAESDFASLIISGPEFGEGDGATISIYYGDPESDVTDYAFKCYDTKELALKDAKILVKLIDEEIDIAQLRRFGFEVMSFK